MGLPSIAYSLSPEGLSLTGQQYATSLLNLLHNEQADMGPSLPSSSKPELHHSWMVQPVEPVDHATAFKPGKEVLNGNGYYSALRVLEGLLKSALFWFLMKACLAACRFR